MTMTLPWYPPAPAAGPASILEFPPDEWALEPKIDGIRVIWWEGRPYTRQGHLLAPSKGAVRLTQVLADIPHALDGEWVPDWDAFYAFDLPDCLLDYDGRRSALAKILNVDVAADFDPPLIGGAMAQSLVASVSRVRMVASYTAGRFAEVYEELKDQGAEGVVFKRRRVLYVKHVRTGVESRDWLKRRFAWD